MARGTELRTPGLLVSGLAVMTLIAGCTTVSPPGFGQRAGMDFIGNIWGNGVTYDSEFHLYWNQVTVENGGKWGSAEPSRDRMRWYDLDLAYQYATDQGFPFRLHTLVWAQQQPGWIGTLSESEQLEEITEWYALLSERYPDVNMIDVVNEPLHETPVYSGALKNAGAGRPEWVFASFRMAREYFPKASLGINDYGILSSPAIARIYAGLVRELKAEGLVDYIGVQGHFLEGTATRTVAAVLDILAEEELPIYVTEFDLNIEDDQLQARRMEELMRTFAANPWVRGVTLWGYREGAIWREDAYLLRASRIERPALTWLREYRDEVLR